MNQQDDDRRNLNLADALLTPNLTPERIDRTAYIDDRGRYSYGELDTAANRIANLLTRLGAKREDRVMLCLHDQFEWPAAFLGAVKAGIVPVATNTMLTSADYDYLLRDSRAKVALIAADVLPKFEPILSRQPHLGQIIVEGGASGHETLDELMATASPHFETVDTFRDEPAFWQYSSGTTGQPKGIVHFHGGLLECARLYARGVLDIGPDDVIYSAARMFFGYGMGNSLGFPLALGATAILHPGRPTPEAVCAVLRRHRPSVFFGVPTLYASILADPACISPDEAGFRLCVSAGEALPAEIGRRWRDRFGIDIIDGLGSTEMLHIFLSNRPGEVKYGQTGRPVPGYEVRVLDENGAPVKRGEIGELHVSGPTSAAYYWGQHMKSQDTFQGRWTRCSDKCVETEDGFFTVVGRSDDMLKVGGIYVSPLEVEGAVIGHPAVAEAAVVAERDSDGLVKPKAFVVLRDGYEATAEREMEIKHHVKTLLAPYKYPRWIEFVDALPKTPTGKIKRFELRHPGTTAAA